MISRYESRSLRFISMASAWVAVCFAGALPLPAFAAGPAKAAAAASREAAPAAAMVITGDREAPLVMSIIPWADPKPVAPPAAPLQPLLPQVIDYNRSFVDDPGNRLIELVPRGTAAK